MSNLMSTSPKNLQMQQLTGEYEGLRKVISYLYDGDQEAFNILYFVKSNYKEWPAMMQWMKQNHLVGKRLVDLFQNESPDGGGYHMGATFVLSRIKGLKFRTEGIKIDELL